MKIFDEKTKLEMENPDLEKGYLYDGSYISGYTSEKIVIMEGTENLRRLIPKTPIYEKCQYYHEYTEEELHPVYRPSEEERLKAIEAAIAELAEMVGGDTNG